MCELCAANEPKMLAPALKDFLRPGVRVAVNYALSDQDAEEIWLIDDETGNHLNISSVGAMCWEQQGVSGHSADNVVSLESYR